jgi:hypothetical protein
MPTEIKEIQIRCLTCGTWFRSPIFFAYWEAFEGSGMMGNTVTCPSGHITGCNKENMRVRFEGGGFVGADTI